MHVTITPQRRVRSSPFHSRALTLTMQRERNKFSGEGENKQFYEQRERNLMTTTNDAYCVLLTVNDAIPTK